MRLPDRSRVRALAGWFAALGAVAALAIVVPGTSSAFTASITNSADTAAAKTRFLCADVFAADRRRTSAYFEYAMGEQAGATTAADSSDSRNPGTYEGSNTKDTTSPTACPNDSGSAYRLDGSSSRITTAKLLTGMNGSFSETIWFKTAAPGKLMGFENSQGGESASYDKHLYIGQSGRLFFGTYNSGMQTLASRTSVMDGTWHQATGTLSSTGSTLYLDGTAIASNASFTTAEDNTGYWRIGQGRIVGWDDAPSSTWFSGSLRFAAAYPYALTAQEVASAWSIGAPGS